MVYHSISFATVHREIVYHITSISCFTFIPTRNLKEDVTCSSFDNKLWLPSCYMKNIKEGATCVVFARHWWHITRVLSFMVETFNGSTIIKWNTIGFILNSPFYFESYLYALNDFVFIFKKTVNMDNFNYHNHSSVYQHQISVGFIIYILFPSPPLSYSCAAWYMIHLG